MPLEDRKSSRPALTLMPAPLRTFLSVLFCVNCRLFLLCSITLHLKNDERRSSFMYATSNDSKELVLRRMWENKKEKQRKRKKGFLYLVVVIAPLLNVCYSHRARFVNCRCQVYFFAIGSITRAHERISRLDQSSSPSAFQSSHLSSAPPCQLSYTRLYWSVL